ncbi:MAG: FMN-binding protein [Lachnospiraceae bacterium]|nr:FMN-binding protein [Lachnospiraceae bacterium]
MDEMNRLCWRIAVVLTAVFILSGMLAGCGGTKRLKDGFYTAEMSEFSHGWQEYLIIQVKDNRIVAAEFNARNESGFIKAWDNAYMKNMMAQAGTYPNEYTRAYVQQLLDGQADTQVDVVTGASHSGQNFEKLAAAVLMQAASGNAATAVVE